MRFRNTTTSLASLRTSMLAALACAALVALPMAGCASDNATSTQAAGTSAQAAGTTARSTSQADLSDGEILGVVKMANEAEVMTSQVAVQKAMAPEVRDFAQQMIDSHSEADQKVDQTAAAEEPPSESVLAATIADEAKARIETLYAQTGPEFDRAYVEAQLKMHQEVLDTIENELLPDTENPEVRQLLETLREDVKQHLAKTEQLQQELVPAA